MAGVRKAREDPRASCAAEIHFPFERLPRGLLKSNPVNTDTEGAIESVGKYKAGFLSTGKRQTVHYNVYNEAFEWSVACGEQTYFSALTSRGV